MSSTVSGVYWKVNYGEIADRPQFRLGRVETNTWEATFPIAELSDLLAVLQAVPSLTLGVIHKGNTIQARKVNTGLFTDVIIEPRLDTGVPAEIFRFSEVLLGDLSYTLQLFAADLSNTIPDDWDYSSPNAVMVFDKYGQVQNVITEAYFQQAVSVAVEGALTTGFVNMKTLTDALLTKADTQHSHAQADITGLSTALSGKAAASHTHAQADITGLSAALDGKASAASLSTKLDSSSAPELILDTVGAALVAGTNVSIVVNDAENTITISSTGGGGGTAPTPVEDATANSKGVLRLAGDLGGTATTPTVPGLANKADVGHTHAQVDVTGLGTALSSKADLISGKVPAAQLPDPPTVPVTKVAGKTGEVVLVKGDVGLGNVDNTTDANKPVSTATQTALNGKAAASHTHAQADVTGLTTALAGKAAASHSHAISDVTGLDTALAGKADSTHTHSTSQVAGLTAALASKAGLVGGKVPDTQLPTETFKGAYDFRMDPTKWIASAGTRLVIPTEQSPAGGQTVHPSVLFFPDGWNGYQYWMAHTPYPNGNDAYEDPCLAVSNDGVTWIAAPGVPMPLDDQPGSPNAYNSDVDLAVGPDNEMFLFWRTYNSSLSSLQEKAYVMSSRDGVNWGTKRLIWEHTQSSFRPLSPSFVFEDGGWTAWAVDFSVASSAKVVRIRTSSADPTTGWGAKQTCSVVGIPAGKAPWHLEVLKVGGQYVMLLNVVDSGTSGVSGLLTLAASTDGLAWQSSPSIIPQQSGTDHNNLYRGSMVPEFNDGVLGLRIWYSAYYNNGTTSVFNVFRTWAGPQGPAAQTKILKGTSSVPTVPAISGTSAGGVNVTISFSPPFSSTPTVIPTTNSGRLHAAVTAVSPTGATLRFENYTAAQALATTCYWVAVE